MCLIVREAAWSYRQETSDADVRRFLSRVGAESLADVLTLRAVLAEEQGGGAIELEAELKARSHALLAGQPPLNAGQLP